MIRLIKWGALLAALLALSLPGAAQSAGTSKVVATCGALPTNYTANSTGNPTVDTEGVTCTNSSGGGGGAATIADGADVAQGAKADAAWTSGSGSMVALLKAVDRDILLGTIPLDGANNADNVATSAALFKGSPSYNYLWDGATWDRAPGTSALGATSNEAFINGVAPLMGQGPTGTGAQRVTLSRDNSSVAINISTATTTQLVALSGSTKIYVDSYNVIAGGTGNITFEYGTGSNCGTGTTILTGAYPLVAQAGLAVGGGGGTVLVVPAGNALCALTTQAVQMSGSLSYQQF